MSYKFNIEVFDIDRLGDYPGQQPISIQNTNNNSVCALNFQQNLMVTYAAPDSGGSLQAHQFFYDANGKQSPVGPLTNYGDRDAAIFCQFVHKGKHYTICSRTGSTTSTSMDLWQTEPRANGAEKMGAIDISNSEGRRTGLASVDLNGTVFLFEMTLANASGRVYVRTSHNAVGEKGEPIFGKDAQLLTDKAKPGEGISATVLNGKIYLVYCHQGGQQVMSIYDGVEWRAPEGIVPAGGAALGEDWVGSNVTALGNRLYYFGYQKCQNIPGPLLSSVAFDPVTEKWGAVTPPAREHLPFEVGVVAPHMNALKLLRPFKTPSA
ncbi:hypothetical protein [Mycobacteroides chelonae]|uniref:hypothetical protein n=1 Tax=Mycobacteroides chelonae TaxID=1774 RepID=UPI0008A9F5B4|nr:hypothetical protein [Mycobacteroides chelonae]OHU63618.1 hypothetical protein BKG85_08860 [Mycobacteroides chelonae]